MTNATAKDREHANWTHFVPGWRMHDTRLRSCFAPVTERMLQAAHVGAGQRVLVIATGTGEPAIPAAEQVGAQGRVLGTDVVEEMLAFARDKAARKGLTNIEFRRVGAEELEVAAGSFDAVLIRWGIEFMPDPLGCLQRAWSALRSGGRIAVACWASPERNPWAAIPLAVIQRHADVAPATPGAPALFAFADPDKLRGALLSAGFSGVELDEVHVLNGGEFEDGAAYFAFIRELAGPIAWLFAQLTPALQQRVADEVAREAAAFRSGTKVGVPGVTWVAHGRR